MSASAKQSIVQLHQILVSLQIKCLSPDDIRQAKYNGPVSSKLWGALLSLVLLQLCNSFHNETCSHLATFLTKFQSDNASDSLPEAAVTVTKMYLILWGCPKTLVSLVHHACDSRPLLLVFGWLIQHCKIFQHWQHNLGSAPNVESLLADLVHDTSTDEHAGSAYCQGLQECTAKLTTAQLFGKDITDNVEVGGLVKSILGLMGRVEKSNKRLATLLEGHIRLHHRTAAVQLERTSSIAPVDSKQALNLFELHLLGNHQQLQAHLNKVTRAVEVVKLQQECQQHEAMFFKWMQSVLLEHQKSVSTREAISSLRKMRSSIHEQVSAALLLAPVPNLAEHAHDLWQTIQQLPQRQLRPADPSKLPGKFSVYQRPAVAKPPAFSDPLRLSLFDFSPEAFLAYPSPTRSELDLPVDILAAFSSQYAPRPNPNILQRESSSVTKDNLGNDIVNLLGRGVRLTYVPRCSSVADAEYSSWAEAKIETAGIMEIALDIAKNLARMRAAGRKKLMQNMAALAPQEGWQVLGL